MLQALLELFRARTYARMNRFFEEVKLVVLMAHGITYVHGQINNRHRIMRMRCWISLKLDGKQERQGKTAKIEKSRWCIGEMCTFITFNASYSL